MRKLYVLVRSDLSKAQQAVQAGHAVAEACLSGIEWKNGTLVYLKVRDLDALLDWYEKIGNSFPFYEPYYKNKMTALAVLGNQPGFEELQLL